MASRGAIAVRVAGQNVGEGVLWENKNKGKKETKGVGCGNQDEKSEGDSKDSGIVAVGSE